MRFARFSVAAICSLASISSFAVPTVLIFQSKQPLKDKTDTNLLFGQYLAHEMDTAGRLSPIVYSIADPNFRAAVNSGKVKNPPDVPNTNDVFRVAHELRADYVLAFEAVVVGKSVHTKSRLFKDKREIWKDEQTLAVATSESLDKDSTGESWARTLVFRMNSGPFKGMADRPKAPTPTLDPGQAPVVSAPTPAAQSVSDDQLKKNVDMLIAANKRENALLLMRDAVDAAPFNVDRRLALINLLMDGHPDAAAEEADRAAILMPEHSELRVLAAKAWMRAGRKDDAQKALNEAVARDPNGASTRLMLGELSLEQLEPGKALPHLDEAIKQHDSAQARFLRGVCRGLLGGTDGMQIDFAQVLKLEPTPSPDVVASRYALAVDITDRRPAQDGNDLRSLIPKIVVKPKDADLRDQIDQALRLLSARTALLTALPAPPSAKQANDLRILAQKLMAQGFLDIQTYSTSGDEDNLADARTNLSEALKQVAAAKNKAAPVGDGG